MSEVCQQHPVHRFKPCVEHRETGCVVRTHHETQGGPAVETDHFPANKPLPPEQTPEPEPRVSPEMKVALLALGLSLAEIIREVIVGL